MGWGFCTPPGLHLLYTKPAGCSCLELVSPLDRVAMAHNYATVLYWYVDVVQYNSEWYGMAGCLVGMIWYGIV